MNIAILGGCGFIGSHLAEMLSEEGHSITIFDHLNATRRNLEYIQNMVRFVGGDFTNVSDVARAIEGAEIVVHLISSTLPGNSLKNPIYDIETNVVGSINLFEQCVKADVRKVVFISSGGTVYGIPQSTPIKETHALNPINPYGLSKMVIEKYLGLYFYHYGMDYFVLRLSNPYGGRQNPMTGQGVIASWMHRAKNGKPIEIWGDGTVVRDYVYIKDAVRALKLATLVNSDQKVLNVGSGKGYSLLQVREVLEEIIGKQVPVTFKNVRRVDVPINVLDISLIKSVLGWEAEIDLKDGMDLMWRDLSGWQGSV